MILRFFFIAVQLFQTLIIGREGSLLKFKFIFVPLKKKPLCHPLYLFITNIYVGGLKPMQYIECSYISKRNTYTK